MKDLFGNVIEEQVKTWEQEYRKYLASAAWKRKREAVIERAGKKCERCGASRWIRPLDVHHLSYEHFKSEPLDDLVALCRPCHRIEDEERWNEMLRKMDERRQARREERYFNRLDGWASKVWGDDWEDVIGYEYASHRFDDFLRRYVGS